MSRKALGGAFVVAFALSGTLGAQSTPPGATQPPAAGQAAEAKTVTVEGCLVRESDVPGRQPNVAERAGVMEDFILTHAKIKDGSGATAQTGATGTAGATGTTGAAAKMFEVRGIDKEELQKYVGQRVEIVGKLDPQDVAERQREKASPTGEPAGDLPEIEGATIRKSASTEPCTPPAK
jgi:hypothetical protein